jgi:hypothetical protein
MFSAQLNAVILAGYNLNVLINMSECFRLTDFLATPYNESDLCVCVCVRVRVRVCVGGGGTVGSEMSVRGVVR